MKINRNYQNLKQSYLFATVSKRLNEYRAANPDKMVISLGIGDVTLPLPPAAVEAMQKASLEMGDKKTFRGYGDYEGCDFLIQAISGYYAKKGVALEQNEIFVSDGAKSDVGNILDIFDSENTVLVPDPVYPVYVDTNIMAGRKVLFMNGCQENDFLPMPDPSVRADIIYLCSPNNPTGSVYTREQLKVWVDYANSMDAIILFDAAYEAFVRDPSLPTSIFQIEGARDCAIEISSLSKTAGFTGTRCGYTVIPNTLKREGQSLRDMWYRRQSTKYNGTPYIIQRGAEAIFSCEGLKQAHKNIDYYMENASIIGDTLKSLGLWYVGGENSPYLWLKCPNNMPSWDFFDLLLNGANVVGTPGEGFGNMGEGFFRLTAFGDHENVKIAMDRLKNLLS